MANNKGNGEWRFSKNGEKTAVFSGAGELENFMFEVVRLKDKETKQEKLIISIYYGKGNGDGKGESYGELHTSIGKLSSDIIRLYDFGINLKRKDLVELAKIISDNFYELPLKWKELLGNNVPEETVIEIVSYFKDYIKQEKIEIKNKCYNIQVKDFSKEYRDSTFAYDEKQVREALRIYGFTNCDKNRNDKVVKLDGKTGEKCISFFADKIDKEGK